MKAILRVVSKEIEILNSTFSLLSLFKKYSTYTCFLMTIYSERLRQKTSNLYTKQKWAVKIIHKEWDFINYL